MTIETRRHVWIAGMLSLCCTGLGHLYAGRLKKGLVLFLLSLVVVPVAALIAGWAASTAGLIGLVASFVGLIGLWLFAVVDACRTVACAPDPVVHEYQRPLIYALFVVAGITSPALCTIYVRQNLLEAFYLPSESMMPALRRGDRILANKTAWRVQNLKHDDCIVFRPPDQRDLNYIKRIIGLPGDTVTIDGERVKVAPGMCFVLGDNRENSRDSRHFGPVPLGDVIGVAEYVYLPGDSWSRFGTFR